MLRPITKEDYASGKPVYAVYMGYSKYLEHGTFYNTEYVAARDKIKVRFTINRDILKRQNWGCEFSPNKFFVEEELKQMIVGETKEVDFHQYCRACEYYEKKEDEEPCYTCIGEAVRTNSRKPINFKEKDK